MGGASMTDEYFAKAARVGKAGSACRITWGFNAALFGFQAILGFLQFTLVSGRAHGVPIVGLGLSTLLDAAWHAAIILAAACFVREAWGRLMPSLASIRAIDYKETVAIVLTAQILLSR